MLTLAWKLVRELGPEAFVEPLSMPQAIRRRAFLKQWNRIGRVQRDNELAELGYLDLGGEA